MQVGPLKKQSEIAKKYLVLRDELRVKEVSVWMETLDRLHAQTQNVTLEAQQVGSELEQARAELEALYASAGNISERMHRKDEENERARDRLSAAEAEAAACSRSLSSVAIQRETSFSFSSSRRIR